jgi:hypothetical protein
MKRAVGHGMFALLLAASIAVKAQMRESASGNIGASEDTVPAVVAVAQSSGLVLEKDIELSVVPMLIFRAPGCAGAEISIAVLDISLDTAPVLPTVAGEGYALRYVYFGRVWQKPDRLGFFFEWKFHKLISNFGLGGYVASPYLLAVDAPRACRPVDVIDWRPVWGRGYPTR